MEYIRASDGNGEAVRGSVTHNRAPGSTVLKVDSHTNYPAKFILTTGATLPDNTLDPATVQVMLCSLSGADINIDAFAPGYGDVGNSVGEVTLIKPATAWADSIADGFSASHKPDGTLKDGIVTTAALADGAVTPEKRSGGVSDGTLDIATTGTKTVTLGYKPKLLVLGGAATSSDLSSTLSHGTATATSLMCFASTGGNNSTNVGRFYAGRFSVLGLNGSTASTSARVDTFVFTDTGFTYYVNTASTSITIGFASLA